jgi:signal transduction histidine kinase
MASQNCSYHLNGLLDQAVLPTILIVDDLQNNLNVFQKLIENNMKTNPLLMTTDPREAFKMALTHHPDAILLDFQMPEMNGIELCKRLKADKSLTDIPVLIITGNLVTPDLKAEGLDAGACDFIVKPIDMAEFIAKVRRVLRTKFLGDNLKNTNKQLRQEIADRKRAEAEAISAKNKAETANKSIKDFLSFISHEIRNPMHHIISFSKLGMEKAATMSEDKIIKYFDNIFGSSTDLLNLLNDLLDLSKSEEGKLEYQMTESCLNKIVDCCVKEWRITAEENDITLAFEEPSESTTLICDAQKIKQVVTNLLANATKFSPSERKIQILIDRSDLDTVPALFVAVKDEGIGIPENELESIFNRFSQSEKTRNKFGGSGLGLAICWEIVRAHNGKIWAENNPEGGATFKFLLPCQHLKTQ